MSIKFARQQGLVISYKPAKFELVDGSSHFSMGFVWVGCGLSKSGDLCQRLFFIYDQMPMPLLLGAPFFWEIHSLPKSSSRLSRSGDIFESPLPFNHDLGQIRPRIRLSISRGDYTIVVPAVPDKGSTNDAVSLQFAQRSGFEVFPCPTGLRDIRLGNNRVITAVGLIALKYSFIDCSSGPGPYFSTDFDVIDGLAFDLALGNPTLRRHRVFENTDEIEWEYWMETSPTLHPFWATKTTGA
jgi:hypothetical protein